MDSKKLNENGAVSLLLIALIFVLLMFFGALGFGYWAYAERTDYKNNVDEKISTAVEVAKKETATQKDNDFIQREKEPLKEYAGPSSFGSVSVKYPKTWSAFVDENGSSTPVDGYFHPNFVPNIKGGTAFALRLQISNATYAEEIKNFDSAVKNGDARAKPYKPVNVDNIIGTQVVGKIDTNKSGVMILLPLRDKTIKIWTEDSQFVPDFEKNILKNFDFSP
ncbi:MAG TPA: hypothetical protein PKB09_02875 [Candidatus Saccharibacteria bacterium]|nr:hypothetical protein [Candidatus Saccharibacteria bacterium]